MKIDLKRLNMRKATALLAKAKLQGKKLDNGKMEVDDEFAEEFTSFFDKVKSFSNDLREENERLRQEITGNQTVIAMQLKAKGKKWKNKIRNVFKKKDKDSKEKQSAVDVDIDMP